MAFLKSANRHTRDGLKHLKEWELEEALKSFEHAEKKKPENPDIKNYISQTYAAMDDMEKATEYILKAITLQPQSPTHKQLYATYLMRQGRNHDAIPIIDETLEIQQVDVIYILVCIQQRYVDYRFSVGAPSVDSTSYNGLYCDAVQPLVHEAIDEIVDQRKQRVKTTHNPFHTYNASNEKR